MSLEFSPKEVTKYGRFKVILSYPRGVLAVLFLIVHTAYLGIFTVLSALIYKNRAFQDWIIQDLWCRPILWFANVKVDLRGAEHIPMQGRGVLYLFNHTSYMDIFAIFSTLPRLPRFGAKIELFSIPIFGQAMKACGVLPIARQDRSAVFKVYEQAEARVEKGECFALAPEGTRQIAGKLGPFKKGPFIFALNAKMDIVPLVIVGAEKIIPKGTLMMNVGAWERTVILQVLPVIKVSQFDTSEALQEACRKAMEQAYEKILSQ